MSAMKNSLAFAVGMTLMGSFFVVNKQIVAEVPVFIASEIRLLMGAIVLFVLSRINGDVFTRFDRRDSRVVFFQAFFGVFLFSIFSLNGLKHTSAVNSGIIMGMTPVAILIVAMLMRQERATWRTVLAPVVACIGVVAINLASSNGPGESSLRGDALVFLAMLGETVFIVAGRFIRGPVSPLVMSTQTAALGALLFLPLAAYSMGDFDWRAVSVVTWLCVAYSGIAITAIGVFLMNHGSARLPMSKAASLSAFMPATSCVLAVLFLGEAFGAMHFFGVALILGSALMTVRPRPLSPA